jgi:hypothetical protein
LHQLLIRINFALHQLCFASTLLCINFVLHQLLLRINFALHQLCFAFTLLSMMADDCILLQNPMLRPQDNNLTHVIFITNGYSLTTWSAHRHAPLLYKEHAVINGFMLYTIQKQPRMLRRVHTPTTLRGISYLFSISS